MGDFAFSIPCSHIERRPAGILLTRCGRLHSHHQENVNPIEKVERSTLIMASTVHQQPTVALIKESSASRLLQASPQLFLKDVAAADWFLGGQFIWYYSTGSNSYHVERYLFLCDTFGPRGLFWMVFMLISWPLQSIPVTPCFNWDPCPGHWPLLLAPQVLDSPWSRDVDVTVRHFLSLLPGKKSDALQDFVGLVQK